MQSGSIFPIAIMAVIVLGVASIVYSRQTVPSADDSPPTINDHWHMAHGFNICGEWYQLEGDLEDRNAAGNFVNTKFLQTGIHSHNDGVIHWHPYTSRAVGSRADLGVFLETYEVELTNDALRFPDSQFDGADYVEGETTCNGEDAEQRGSCPHGLFTRQALPLPGSHGRYSQGWEVRAPRVPYAQVKRERA